MKQRVLQFGAVLACYLTAYLVSRQVFGIGMPFYAYTPDWAARNILLPCALVSAFPTLLGRFRFAWVTSGGYLCGVVLGELLGGFQSHLPPQYPHYGWIICIAVYGGCLRGIPLILEESAGEKGKIAKETKKSLEM